MEGILLFLVPLVPLWILQFFKKRKYGVSFSKELKDELGITPGLLISEPEDLEPIGTGKKQYKIYKNNKDKIRIVKVGWSFPGFLFPLGWYIYKKMYRSAELYITLSYVGIFISYNYPIYSTYILYTFQFIYSFVTGYKGNTWYTTDLLYIRGYALQAIVNANSIDDAKKYYKLLNEDIL